MADKNVRTTINQFLLSLQKTYNISDKEMSDMLVREACNYKDKIPYQSESKEWDEAYHEKEAKFKEEVKPTYEKLWKLYEILEQQTIDWLVENPDVIQNLKEVRDSQLNYKGLAPSVGFGFGFDDVFGRLKKGMPGGMDMSCGFTIGTRSIVRC